jgi:hypothetical protein
MIKAVVTAFLTFVVARYLVAHGWRVGFLSVLFLWWLIALIYPKYVHNPVHLVRKHGRRWVRAMMTRKIGFPVAGFVVYLTFPLALPLVVFIWLWSLSYSQLKGKYKSLGERFRKGGYDVWKRTTRATAEEIRIIVTFCTVGWAYLVGAYQALEAHHRRWGHEPVSGVGGQDGRDEDQPCQTGGEGTN